MNAWFRNAALALALLLAGCAPLAGLPCPDGARPVVSDQLYFGTARPDGGVVSAAEWSGFLRDVVTPRFPSGLTTWQAAGQWRDARGAIDHEAAYVVSLVHPDDAGSEQAVRAIVADYKTRFAQEAVLRVTSAGCASY